MLDLLQQGVKFMNESRYFWGVSLLMLNLGSRYIVGDLTAFHNKVLANELMKKFVLFSLFFVATRDVITSLTLTLIFVIIVYGIFHEHSKYSLIPDDKHVKERLAEYYRNN